MKHLKLSKGLSYMGHGVTVTRQEPDVFVEDADTAAALIATGYYTEAGNEPVTPPQAAPTGTIEAIDTMGVTKLRAYAKEHGIDKNWPTGTSAEDIRADIKAALEEKAEEDDPSSQFTSSGDTEDEETGSGSDNTGGTEE